MRLMLVLWEFWWFRLVAVLFAWILTLAAVGALIHTLQGLAGK
jgi:hypothetical protein